MDALLSSGRRDSKAIANDPAAVLAITEIAVEALQPGRYQPLRQVQEQGLRELADFTREQRVMRPAHAMADGNSRFDIVAGERHVDTAGGKFRA